MRPMSAFLLKVWHATDTSMEPLPICGESPADYLERYDVWEHRHRDTCRLLYYYAHSGINFASKISFMAEWL